MQTYSYRPLADQTIRLLGLQDSTSDTFSGTLKTFKLSEAPAYFCLSYTWGAPSKDVQIQIDGDVLYVRPSLVEILRRLLELSSDVTRPEIVVEWVWIDRVCINQDDIDERSEQVRCMGMIYSQAVRTIIWAGPDLNGSSAAWRLIGQIHDICVRENPDVKYLADIPLQIYSDQNHASFRLPPWDDELWEHLRGLFSLPWFTRTWIIQEVALSSKDPILLHGRHMYSWDRLGWAASWLRRKGYLRLRQIPDQLQNCDTISNIRRSRNHWDLDALLATTSVKFKSTDQRDKIYGLLGLAAETQNTGSLPSALVPDYNLEVWELYTKVVLHFLREKRTLPTFTLASGIWGDIARAQHTNQYKRLPSWVPNWSDCCVSNSEHTKGFSWLYYSSTGEATWLGFPKTSNASAGLLATVLDSHDESVLRLKGLVTATIVNVVPYEEDSETTERNSLLKAYRIARRFSIEKSTVAFVTAFVNASTAEQYRLSGKSAEQIQKDGSAYLLEILETDTAPEIGDKETMEELAKMSAGGSSKSYFSLARNFCHHRAFILTSDGHIGISSLGTQPGDTVAVIFGGGVPYVIRKSSDHFLFVSEAYIHGLMNGEMVQQWREGQLEEEVLEFH
ncbi:HET domain-containing protein [Pyrenochaeta sp. DS3sAY3a]|nr:HET domain-containing protein [Pyrenochaeta sp. DS3sAY3a]